MVWFIDFSDLFIWSDFICPEAFDLIRFQRSSDLYIEAFHLDLGVFVSFSIVTIEFLS